MIPGHFINRRIPGAVYVALLGADTTGTAATIYSVTYESTATYNWPAPPTTPSHAFRYLRAAVERFKPLPQPQGSAHRSSDEVGRHLVPVVAAPRRRREPRPANPAPPPPWTVALRNYQGVRT